MCSTTPEDDPLWGSTVTTWSDPIPSILSRDNQHCCWLVITPFLCFMFYVSRFFFFFFGSVSYRFTLDRGAAPQVILACPAPSHIAVILDVMLAVCDCALFFFSVEGNPKPANRDSSTMEAGQGLSFWLGFCTLGLRVEGAPQCLGVYTVK